MPKKEHHARHLLMKEEDVRGGQHSHKHKEGHKMAVKAKVPTAKHKDK